MNIVGEVRIECVTGDIAAQDDIDVVVNAANAQLLTGSGVAGALHAAAGPKLAEAGRPLAPIGPGEAVITPAFDLPNQYVVHCLGPVYGSDEPAAELLARCYREALRLAAEAGATSIAFPAISTGAFGYPLEEAAQVAIAAVRAACEAGAGSVTLVRFVLFDELAEGVHQQALRSAP